MVPFEASQKSTLENQAEKDRLRLSSNLNRSHPKNKHSQQTEQPVSPTSKYSQLTNNLSAHQASTAAGPSGLHFSSGSLPRLQATRAVVWFYVPVRWVTTRITHHLPDASFPCRPTYRKEATKSNKNREIRSNTAICVVPPISSHAVHLWLCCLVCLLANSHVGRVEVETRRKT